MINTYQKSFHSSTVHHNAKHYTEKCFYVQPFTTPSWPQSPAVQPTKHFLSTISKLTQLLFFLTCGDGIHGLLALSLTPVRYFTTTGMSFAPPNQSGYPPSRIDLHPNCTRNKRTRSFPWGLARICCNQRGPPKPIYQRHPRVVSETLRSNVTVSIDSYLRI